MKQIKVKWKVDKVRLSIDGSTDAVGYCVWYGMERLKSGTYHAVSGEPEKRVESIRFFIDTLIKEYKVKDVILEDIQLQYRNRIPQVHVYRALAMVRGVIANTAFRNECKIYFINPSEWRSALGIKCGGGSNREISKQSAVEFMAKYTKEAMEIDEIEAICIGMGFMKIASELDSAKSK